MTNLVVGSARKVSVPALATAIVVVVYGLFAVFSVPAPDAAPFVAAATFILTTVLDFVIPEKFQSSAP